MTLLDRIKELCMEKGINPSKLEIELGFGRATLYKWEKSSPTSDKIEKVADYFGVSIDYLLGRTAFRTPMQLFEHWGGYSDRNFESAFDFGELLKKERKSQGVSINEVSKALDITESDVEDIEEGLLPLNYDWAEKYASFLGTSVTQIFSDNEMYDEQIPAQFNGDVKAYENFKRAEKEDTNEETLSSPQPMQTIAAHFKGKEISEEKLRRIEKFIEFTLNEDE